MATEGIKRLTFLCPLFRDFRELNKQLDIRQSNGEYRY